MDRYLRQLVQLKMNLKCFVFLVASIGLLFSCSKEEKKPGEASSPSTSPVVSVTKPVITSPSSSPVVSNQATLTIGGSCTTGNTISLSGSATQSVTCSGAAFSFAVNPGEDGIYSFSVQASQDGTTSEAESLSWTRDTTVPGVVVILGPGSSPYVTGDTQITIEGICESGADVTIVDQHTNSEQSLSCASSSFAYTSATKSSNGNYTFQISQQDQAGNASDPVGFVWTLDTSIPPTPVISVPASSPHHTNNGALVISGSCVPDYSVELSGSSVQSTICSNPGATFSFSVDLTVVAMGEGNYEFFVLQNDGLVGATNSQSATRKVTYDVTAPADPSLASPVAVASTGSGTYMSAGNITVRGNCESNATVLLSGGDAQSTTCTSGAFSFDVTASCGISKTFYFGQRDRAGNNSAASTSLAWTRDCTMLSDPIIASPTAQPYVSGSTSLTISGSCETGNFVELSGSVSAGEVTGGALVKECVGNSYSFTIDKSADSQPAIKYTLSLQQQNTLTAPTQESNSIPFVWIRAGVDDTLALYSLDFSDPAADRSAYNNDIVNGMASTSSVTGVDGQARETAGTGSLGAAHSPGHRTYSYQMTFEAWIKLQSMPVNSASDVAVIAEKQNAWRLSFVRQGGSSKHYISFQVDTGATCTGTFDTTISSRASNFTVPHTGFKKVAVVWDEGRIEVYFDYQLMASGNTATPGNSKICDSTSGGFWLGSTAASTYILNGAIDEVGLSQVLRDPSRPAPLAVD